jgi:hypothetical protein
LFYAHDGWGGTNFQIDKGVVMIRAWTSQVVRSAYILEDVSSDDTSYEDKHSIEFDEYVDIDKYINVIQVSIPD